MEDTVKTVTIRKLSRETKKVLADLPVVITSYGKPIAVLMAYDNRQSTDSVQGVPASGQREDTPDVSRNVQSDKNGELESFS